MHQTAVEKILMKHSVTPVDHVVPGDFVTCRIDYAGMHEGFDARKYDQFTPLGEITGVFDPAKIGMFVGHHFCTGHSDELAEDQQKTREFAEKLGIRVFNFGSGIAHVIIMEEGYAHPGALCVFGDSHTTAYGAVGAISAQCGIEMSHVFLAGTLWFKVPVSHKYVIEGTTGNGVYPRDVIQHIVGKVGMDASVYACLEWDGSYIHSLPVPLRFPFTLMSVELGGKCSFIEPDEITLAWLKGRVKHPFEVVKSDPGASYEKTYTFDVSGLEPQVCAPSSPDNTKPIGETLGARIDQVCIGTCTGGSIYDFREAARILKGGR